MSQPTSPLTPAGMIVSAISDAASGAPLSCASAPEPMPVKASWFWIKDTRGYGSVTVTLLTIAFVITSLAYVLAIFEQLGPVKIRPFDVGAASTYFIPLLTAYVYRKFTDAKFGANKPGGTPPA